MMKKLFAWLPVLGLLVAPAVADYYVAGDFNVAWDPANAGYQMTETFAGSGIWELNLAGEVAGRHEFKVTDGTWGWTQPGGPNSWLYTDDGNIKITFDENDYAGDIWSPTQYRLGLDEAPAAGFTAVGNWQTAAGGSDWTNNDPVTAMTDMGGGLFKYETTLPAGAWEWKAVATGSWDSISWDNRSVNTANWGFNTDAVNDTVIFWVDNAAGTARVEVVPEPGTLALLGLAGLALFRRR